MLYCDKEDLKGRGLNGGGCTGILGWLARGSLSADMWGDGLRSEEERVQRPLGARVAEGLSKHRDRGRGGETCLFPSPLSSHHIAQLLAHSGIYIFIKQINEIRFQNFQRENQWQLAGYARRGKSQMTPQLHMCLGAQYMVGDKVI